ncbi:hypothetical protein [Phaeobacter phage MD18]|nr:hypothetical protein [Phaeobacter phage MD18]
MANTKIILPSLSQSETLFGDAILNDPFPPFIGVEASFTEDPEEPVDPTYRVDLHASNFDGTSLISAGTDVEEGWALSDAGSANTVFVDDANAVGPAMKFDGASYLTSAEQPGVASALDVLTTGTYRITSYMSLGGGIGTPRGTFFSYVSASRNTNLEISGSSDAVNFRVRVNNSQWVVSQATESLVFPQGELIRVTMDVVDNVASLFVNDLQIAPSVPIPAFTEIDGRVTLGAAYRSSAFNFMEHWLHRVTID